MQEYDHIQEPSWGWGVFYAYDSNSVDQRCRWLPDKNLYDCPGGIIPWGQKFIPKKVDMGSGGYPAGNPDVNANNGGGTGCHWDGSNGVLDINQFDGDDGQRTLLENRHCECSYAFKRESWEPVDNGWSDWVEQFSKVAMGGNKVYSEFGDLSACWVNNPRDMINLQNHLWWKRTDWNDQLSPLADYWNAADYVHWRRYWGWNEVPVSRADIQNVQNWDAVVIYLPAGICSNGVDTPYCLSSDVQKYIDSVLDQWVSAGYLKVGSQYTSQRPGSYVVFARQKKDDTDNYQIEFFCQSWQNPGNKYKVVWVPISKSSSTGACWVDWNKNKESGLTVPLRNVSGATRSNDAQVRASDAPRQNLSQTVQATDQTSVTAMLNDAIKVGSCNGCYNGGKGVIVRNPFDGYEDKADWRVVPSSFVVNDIVAPTSIFPTGWNGWEKGNGNPDCPNPKSNGFKTMPACPRDSRTGESGPWNYATTAYVIASRLDQVFYDFGNIQLPTWGWGVFYATDSNSVDGRCEWRPQDNGYDCPGGWIPWGGSFQPDAKFKGAGSYPPGNPLANATWGGGAGCHFSGADKIIDQTPADPPGTYLSDKYCQCNYVFNDNWEHWVQTWMAHAHNYREQDGWFAKGKAPGHALDQVACWVNNPRDMINLQNHIYLRRFDWANQISPQSAWSDNAPGSLRVYWGWNEVPISRETARNEQLRDAVVIKLPAGICGGNGGDDSLHCLGEGQAKNLEGDLDLWVSNGIMKVGAQYVAQRPGSYVVIMREWMHSIDKWGPDNWSRWFFCENWSSPSGKYKIVFQPQMGDNPGACYVDSGIHNERSPSSQEVVV